MTPELAAHIGLWILFITAGAIVVFTIGGFWYMVIRAIISLIKHGHIEG